MDTQAQSKLIQCNEIEKEAKPQKVSKFRRFLPQVRELLFPISKFHSSNPLKILILSIENKFLFVDFGCNSKKSHYSQHITVFSISVDRYSIVDWFKQ